MHSVFWKISCALFSCNTRFEIRLIALSPVSFSIKVVILKNKKSVTTKGLRSEPAGFSREYQNKENAIFSGIKCVSLVIKICSGNCKWLLLILIFTETKLFHKFKFWLLIGTFS